jgi:hypothetical protein
MKTTGTTLTALGFPETKVIGMVLEIVAQKFANIETKDVENILKKVFPKHLHRSIQPMIKQTRGE